MIHSMTAFSRVQRQGEWGSAIIEIRSVNHRYLDINLSLPDILHSIDMPIRKCIREFAKRGKIECVIRYQRNSEINTMFNVNMSLVRELCQAGEQVATLLTTSAPVCAIDVLRWPGVLEAKEGNISVLQQEMISLVEQAMKELLLVRGREGEEIKQLFIKRLDLLQAQLNLVRQRLPQVIMEQQKRLKKRFVEAQLELDSTRLEQEMVMFSQKIDIAEEIERMETHITEFHRILMQDNTIGRRLDFLLQELNREANTLGSKSIDPVVSHGAVEMKVLIEQIREQAQNIE
jgi:uncharacterized protein (TIGR00255 family)